ncbi:diguanylate cyclase [Halomonas sp. MCCC 1A17488]|uniref:Diguanylate cyclase n=1 Tax=Billgrantia sulfidoxydans TaxID=2733484 RepID=A0ABX7W6U0_9GAMM|nr:MULTISPECIES: diguanylate cyclase [Halomonas]MCE8014772.1 diguanylate cyclase [Halomonas sp. MCCC 1A17488]MCG3238105.1 diguanylate cyclase [Halomonas sp. MCCC 1A17488]QPP48123.1 diguanylate cyclase [Halomonas sp. SS10-MC5]QTP55412.1 diguanylate cyclase [Halomonas sulfidoxydans]
MTEKGNRPPGKQLHVLAQHPARLVQHAFEQSQTGLVITDGDGNILLVNDAFCRIAGVDSAETRGWPIEHFYLSRRIPSHLPVTAETPPNVTHSWQQEVLCRRADGESLPVLMTVDAILDAHQQPRHFLHTFVQLTSANGEWLDDRHWIHIDPITGLPNWLLLRDRLGHALAQAERADTTLALLFIDIDRFKAINDSLGHTEGDRMLGELAQRLQREVRSRDTLARLGSDQFVVLLEKDGTPESAQLVAERLQEALEPPFTSGDRYLLMTASIGIALYPTDAQDVETLLTAARGAMFTARKKGPGRLAFVDHRLTAQLKEKHRLETLLSEAIHMPNQHFELHYQPELDRRSLHCTGLEAVLRWKRPTRWQHPPGHYLDTLARLGLGVRLNRWMIQTAVADHRQWHDSGSDLGRLPVSLQLCESHLAQDTFDHRPLDLFLRHQEMNSFEWLTLKVPAHGLGSDLDRAIHLLKRLERLGIRLAVEGFGRDSVDLPWLARLPFQKATVDARLVGMHHDGRRLVEASCRMLNALDIEPVIVGIDDESLATAVEGVSARLVQGNLYSPAMAAAALSPWLEAHGPVEE